jgi:ABC-type antimicrobial peptide transport system permease subunit
LYLVLASVGSRRRELAILRVLGFQRRDTRRSVVTQAVAVTLVPLAIGIPIGVLTGRALWNTYASDLDIAPEPATQWPPLLAVTAIALGLAIIFGVVGAAAANHRVPAHDLRAE